MENHKVDVTKIVRWIDLLPGDLYVGFGGYLLVLDVTKESIEDYPNVLRYVVTYYFDDQVLVNQMIPLRDTCFMKGDLVARRLQ